MTITQIMNNIQFVTRKSCCYVEVVRPKALRRKINVSYE